MNVGIGEDWRVIRAPNSPIRVMRIIARMNMGGPAVQVSGLMRGFNSVDFDQRLYTGFCAADEANYLEVVATDVKAIRIVGLGRHVRLTGDMKALVALVKAIKSFKRIASMISFHKSIRVHTFHGHLLNGYFGPFKRSLIVMAEKVLAIFTHQLLAVGDKVREDLLEVGIGNRKKFGLMPPGLEICQLPNKADSQELFGLSTTILQCAFIGRVTQIKRPDRFLDVVSEIKKRGLALEFFMAGDGELLESCRERIDREDLPVKILGWQSNIERVLAAANIVLLTSDNEGTPLCLIQAGMAGLPVVTTRVGSVPDVVLDGTTGIIVSLDVEEIADALERLCSDKGLSVRMGAAAKEFTLSNFGVERLVRDHEELYKKLITNNG